MNIDKRCLKDWRCGVYWKMIFKGQHYRSASKVWLYWTLVVGPQLVTVVPKQWYGHVDSGSHNYHGNWGLFGDGNWGHYEYTCYIIFKCNANLKPQDPVEMCFCGTRLEWPDGHVEKDWKFSAGWPEGSGTRMPTWREAGGKYPKV